MTERKPDAIIVSNEEYERFIQWGLIDETKHIQMSRKMRMARLAWIKSMEQEG